MKPELIQRLKIGPSIILLGQEYLCPGLATNPFIDVLKERYPDLSASSLPEFLPKLATEDKSAILAWLHRRSQKIPISESLATLSDFPWNHAYASAIDEVWVRAFAKNWRSTHAIFTEKNWPQNIRDRHRLCSTFLFGCVDKEDDDSRIPREEFELDGRRQIAVSLLRRLPDILTPRGLLVIEGWNPKSDWLIPADLFPVLKLLSPSQVLIFSANAEHRADGRLGRLQTDGILSFINESLAENISAAVAAGQLSLGDPGALLPNGRQITINSELAFIPKDIFLQLEPFAVILDDNLTLPPRPRADDSEYFEYLRFLEQPVKVRNWEPYAQGFPFKRDFYFSLEAQAEKFLTNPQSNRGPILLHGETGTGKTVALANFAYQTAARAQFPVIFIERSSKSIDSSEWRSLDRFLNWAEDAGAEASLVIWDGMRPVEDYTELWSRLADRGRKAALVGSTYLVPTEQRPKFCIEAGRLFNPQERARFLEYLEKRAPEVANLIKEKTSQIDEAYLVALYRLLPPVRPSIRVGVVEEFQTDQATVLQRIRALPQETSGFNTLEAALEAAGKLTLPAGSSEANPEQPWVATSMIHGESLNTLQKLFALVMTAGRYGCRMPIELLLATLGQAINARLLEALRTNVIVWHEAPNGDIFLEPRQPLEAQIYIESLFGGRAEPEADLICELIKGLPRPSSSVGAATSIDFILELLQVIGPNSTKPAFRKRFERCTLHLANALRHVREHRNVVHPSLMLQEATLYREGVRSSEKTILIDDKIGKLQHAARVLEQALDLPTSQWLRSVLSEELTACLGTIISSQMPTASREQIRLLYVSARDAFRKARLASPTNIHATVTLGWITRPLIEHRFFTPDEQTEITADLVSVFDEAEEIPMDFRQQEYYLSERTRVMDLLGNTLLSNEAFEKLKAIGSKAGYYLRARSLFSEFPEGPPTPEAAAKLTEAIAYLQHNWSEIQNDAKCVNLFFTIWWRLRVGKKPFEEERQVLPFTDGEWNQCHDLVDRLFHLAGPEARPSVRFLRALSNFHIGQLDASEREFRQLANDNTLVAGGLRLRKLFMASRQGKPLEFDGQVLHDLAEHELGRIWVNQLRCPVAVLPRDFDRKQLRKGDPLSDFHIAFSFAGAIAQPPHFLRNR